MTKKATVKVSEIEEDEISDVNEYKVERFFSEFAEDESFKIKLYKHEPSGKRIVCKEFENIIPDMFEDVQKLFGGGTYEYYATFYVNGKAVISEKTGKPKFESVKFHMANPSSTASGSSSKKEVLEEMMMYKQLFGSSQGSTDQTLFLKLMESNAKSIETLMKFQLEEGKRITDLIMSQKKETKPFSEIMEVVEFVQSLQGGNSDSSGSAFADVMKMLVPVAGQLVGNALTPGTPTPSPAPQIAEINHKKIADSFPDEFKEKVTPENRDIMIQKFYEKNSSKFSYIDCQKIIDAVING